MLGARQQTGLGIPLGHVEPALLERAAIGTENRFERKRRCAGQRVLLNPDGIVHAVELDGLAERRVDDFRGALDGGLEAADIFQAVERPDDLLRAESGRRVQKRRSGAGATALPPISSNSCVFSCLQSSRSLPPTAVARSINWIYATQVVLVSAIRLSYPLSI